MPRHDSRFDLSQRSDAESIFAFQSDPRITEAYHREAYKTIEDSRRWLEERLSEHGRRESMFWVFALKGQDAAAIDSCCLWNLDRDSHRAELGYELNSSHWGRGS